jgi:hypothetical protein
LREILLTIRVSVWFLVSSCKHGYVLFLYWLLKNGNCSCWLIISGHNNQIKIHAHCLLRACLTDPLKGPNP